MRPAGSESRGHEKGFTLIELLIVIGIIGFLAAAVLVAVDPVKRIQDSRDSRRHSEVNALLNAILNQQVDAGAYFPGDKTTGSAPFTEHATDVQVIVKSTTAIDCLAGASTRPVCAQLGTFTINNTGTLTCVVRLDRATGAPGAPTVGAPAAGGSVTLGLHSYKVTFVTETGETQGGTTSTQVNVTTGGTQTVPLTAIPTGPSGSNTKARKIYRTVTNDVGNHKLVTTINDNTTTTFNDTIADGSLGADVPTANTTGLSPKYISDLPTDPGTSIGLGGGLALGDTNTGYFINRNPTSRRITIGACYGENNTAIRVTR